MKEAELRKSMTRELNAINRALQKERFVYNVAPAVHLSHAIRNDCSAFIHKSPETRLKFAQESGLLPND